MVIHFKFMDLLNLENYDETIKKTEFIKKSMETFDSLKMKKTERSEVFLKKVNLDKGKSKKKIRQARHHIKYIIRNKPKGIWDIPDNF